MRNSAIPNQLNWTDYHQSVRRITAKFNPKHGNYRIHDHEFVELAFVVSGTCLHHSVLGDSRPSSGDVFLFRPGAWHGYAEVKDFSIYNCCFDTALLGRELSWLADDPYLGRLLWGIPLSAKQHGMVSLHLKPQEFKRCCKLLDELCSLSQGDSAVVSTGPNSARVDLTDGRKFYVSADPNSAGNLQFTEVLANGTTNRNISSGLGMPSISQLSDRFMAKNTTLGPVAFTVGISSGSASNLILSGHSENQSLMTDGNILFGGSGTNRTMTITPVANSLGTTAINISATTPGGGTAMDSFQLTVIAPPTLMASNITPSGGNLTMTWPTNFIGWSLQAQTNGINLGLGTNWTTISSSVNTNVMVIPINQTSGSVFYRLTYP